MKTEIAADNYGQLIFTGIKGTSLTPEESAFIESDKIGGVVLFSNNFEDPAQLAELVNSIQKIRDEYPLFIAVEQEGGRYTQFKKHFTQLPSMQVLTKGDSPKLVFEGYEILAKELSACGVNVCLSPVCDTLTKADNTFIGDRAFSSDPESVEKFISAAIRGLQTNSIMACAKHFPGAGGTYPLIKTGLDELRNRELIPFVKASKSRVEFMMMGHLQVDALDEQMPTTLSAKAYDFLRTETKFTKIILTEEMDSKIITDKFSPEEAAVLAINAGADVLFYRDPAKAKVALGAIREATKKRNIRKEALLEKLQRVEKCKKEYLNQYQPIYIPKIVDAFNTKEAKKFSNSLTGKV